MGLRGFGHAFDKFASGTSAIAPAATVPFTTLYPCIHAILHSTAPNEANKCSYVDMSQPFVSRVGYGVTIPGLQGCTQAIYS